MSDVNTKLSWYRINRNPKTYLLAISQVAADLGHGQALVRQYGKQDWRWVLLDASRMMGRATDSFRAMEAADGAKAKTDATI